MKVVLDLDYGLDHFDDVCKSLCAYGIVIEADFCTLVFSLCVHLLLGRWSSRCTWLCLLSCTLGRNCRMAPAREKTLRYIRTP